MYEEDSIAGLLREPERLAQFARWSVDDLFGQLLRFGYDPRRYSDDAVTRRAERDVAADLEGDARIGCSHTDEQARDYRERYTTSYLAAWRDPEMLRAAQERRARCGYFVVCMR